MDNSIIKVDNVSFRYPRGKDYVIKNAGFSVKKGEFLAITGENGAGKTTMCQIMSGIIPNSQEGKFFGDVTVCGLNTKEHPLAKITQKVGIVLEDPETQIFTTEVLEEVAFGAENIGMPAEQIMENVKWALDVVTLTGFESRHPMMLSGGQKQRVAIASALTMQPDVLILDEPTSQLDPVGTVEVFQVVKDLKEKYGMTIIMVTHKSEEIAAFADRVLVMHQGGILAEGTPQEIFSNQEIVQKAWLAIPQVSELTLALKQKGVTMESFPILLDEGVRAVEKMLNER